MASTRSTGRPGRCPRRSCRRSTTCGGLAEGELDRPGAGNCVDSGMPVLEGGGEHERLERRAGLAAPAHGQVELRRRRPGPKKSRPPTMARTWPVAGSMATTAASGSVTASGRTLGDGLPRPRPAGAGRWWCGCAARRRRAARGARGRSRRTRRRGGSTASPPRRSGRRGSAPRAPGTSAARVSGSATAAACVGVVDAGPGRASRRARRCGGRWRRRGRRRGRRRSGAWMSPASSAPSATVSSADGLAEVLRAAAATP